MVGDFSPRSGRLPNQLLFREPYVLFVGSTHLFAGRRTVSLAELDQQPFILRQCCEKLGTGRRLLATAHVRFKVVARARQEASAAALVASGVGCTLAPKSWLRPGLHAVKIDGLPLERAVAMMWKAKANAGKAASIVRKLELRQPPAYRSRSGHDLPQETQR